MVHCVHKFSLFKFRLWFIANAKHFTYAACWIFQKFKFSINHCRLQQQATFLQLDCVSKSWESSKSVVLAAFWRPMTLHLCRLQQQATFSSSIASQNCGKCPKLWLDDATDALFDELFSRIAHSSTFFHSPVSAISLIQNSTAWNICIFSCIEAVPLKSCSYREDEYHFSFSCFTRYL